MGKDRSHGTLLILLAAILWGTTGTSQALAPHGAHPLTVGALRLAVGGCMLSILAFFSGKFTRSCFSNPAITLLAAALVATYQLSFFAAVTSTGVAIGTMVAIGSGPVFAGLASLLLHKERPDRRWLAATILATLGLLVLLIPSTGDKQHVRSAGVLLALAAGASYAGYTLAIKRLLPGNSPNAVIAIVFTLGAVMLSPVLFHSDLNWSLEPGGILIILHLGVVTTALAYLLFAHGLRSVPAVNAVTLSLAEPLTAATLGILILKERLTTTTTIGMLLVLAGLFVLGIPRSRQHTC